MRSAAHIIARFGKKYSVSRPAKAGQYVNGRWTPSANTKSFNIMASVQPIDGEQLQMLPEGIRTSELRTLYTSTRLKTASESETKVADVVSIDGASWEVHKVEKWDPNMLEHYKCIVVRMDRQE